MIRFRVLFALIGGFACLLGALLLEGVMRVGPLAGQLNTLTWPLLIYRGEIARRVEQAGGQSGEVQVSLLWNNRNDLDLWCIDPSGTKIWFMNRRSPTGGQLDVDANAMIEHLTSSPVENIFWSYGQAPLGKYRVFVHYYANHGDPDPTHYVCRMLIRGNVKQYQGKLWPHDTAWITDFDVGPATNRGIGLAVFSFWKEIAVVGIWVGILMGMLAFGFLSGLWVVYRRFHLQPAFTWKELVPRFWRMGGGGILLGALSQALFHIMLWVAARFEGDMLLWEKLFRVLGWMVLGCGAGWWCSRWVPHFPLPTTRRMGTLAGLLAALQFNAMLQMGLDAFGRMIAAALLGAFIGWSILLVLETAEVAGETEEAILLPVLEPSRLRPQRARGVGVVRLHSLHSTNRVERPRAR